MEKTMKNDKFIKIQTILVLLGIGSRNTIYRWMKDPEVKFPRQYQLGPRRVAWKESEILAWMGSREVVV